MKALTILHDCSLHARRSGRMVWMFSGTLLLYVLVMAFFIFGFTQPFIGMLVSAALGWGFGWGEGTANTAGKRIAFMRKYMRH